MNHDIYQILRRPLVTEKTSYQTGKLNQVSFEVDAKATKAQIKDAIETIFKVTVDRVNIINTPAKRTRRLATRRMAIRRKAYKKAIITLAAGNTIDVFEGVR
ncbi:MAG: 50S ribosomal protein L23 [Anaerolineae bacterium]|nr:MAG: 50S ribosomal protein L23 [Anaerolineae bacterium]